MTAEARKWVWIGIAALAAAAVMLAPLPSLADAGRTALGVLLFALILWITEALPFHITGLLSLFLMAVFRADTFQHIVAAGFGNDIFIFFVGVLVLSAFITRSGLGKRVSAFIISRTGNRVSLIILGFILTGALLSMWISEIAAVAILTPLAKDILEQEKTRPGSNFGKGLMIATAWGCVAGGMGTPAGSGTNPLAIGFLKDMAGIDVSFLRWMSYGIPAALLLILPTWGVLMFFFKPEVKRLSKSSEELKEEYRNLPPMRKEEKLAVFALLLTAALWLATPLLERISGLEIPISMPILLTNAVFFLPKVSSIKWRQVERDISWSGIILILCGISLGKTLYDTGAAAWLSASLLGGAGDLPLFARTLMVILGVSVLKIALTSNTVTGTIVIPILIALARNAGTDAFSMVIPAALTSSMAFLLVTSTPVNIIPHAAGYFTVGDMAKAGAVLTVIAALIITVVIIAVGGVGF
ncbi:MAG: DASS family sodium-coupled anion symporter [Clostridiales bacterium]|nr:DASS family sodium-coupled anion symporter [Clostridiales bacterium]